MKKKIFGLLLASTATFSLIACDNTPQEDSAIIDVTDGNGNVTTQIIKPTEDPTQVAITLDALMDKTSSLKLEDFSKLTVDLSVLAEAKFEMVDALGVEENVNLNLDLNDSLMYEADFAKIKSMTGETMVYSLFDAIKFYDEFSLDGTLSGTEDELSHEGAAKAQVKVFNDGAMAYIDLNIDDVHMDKETAEIPLENGGYYFDIASNLGEMTFDELEELVTAMVDLVFMMMGKENPFEYYLGSDDSGLEVMTSEMPTIDGEGQGFDLEAIVDTFGITIDSVNGTNVTLKFNIDGEKLYAFIDELGLVDLVLEFMGDEAPSKTTAEPVIIALLSTFSGIDLKLTVNSATGKLTKISADFSDFLMDFAPLIFSFIAEEEMSLDIDTINLSFELNIKYEANFPTIDTSEYEDISPYFNDEIEVEPVANITQVK